MPQPDVRLPDMDRWTNLIIDPDVSDFTEESFSLRLQYRSRDGKTCELKLQWSDVIALYIHARTRLEYEDEEAGWMTPAVHQRIREVYKLPVPKP